MSSPELQPNRFTDDEDKNKCSIELRLTVLRPIANKKMSIYSSASIAANPMLPAGIRHVCFYFLIKSASIVVPKPPNRSGEISLSKTF